MLSVKKAPHWAGWTTVLVGMTISLVVKLVLTPELIQETLGWAKSLSPREFKDSLFAISVVVNVAISGAWFMFTCLFKQSEEHKLQADRFFEKAAREVTPDEEGDDVDISQCVILGRMCLCYGGFIMLLIFIPNTMTDRLTFVFCGGVVTIIGLLLLRAAKKNLPSTDNENLDIIESSGLKLELED